MNALIRRYGGLLIYGVAIVTALPAQTGENEIAGVIRCQGPSLLLRPGVEPRQVKVGAILKPGSTIQTGSNEGCYLDVSSEGPKRRARVRASQSRIQMARPA